MDHRVDIIIRKVQWMTQTNGSSSSKVEVGAMMKQVVG